MPPDVTAKRDDARVVPFMRLVPNGVTKSGKLKATLIVTPQKAPEGDGFPLAEWPSQIVDHLKKLSKEASETVTAADKAATTKFKLRICGGDPCTIGIPSTIDATFSVALATAKEIKEVVALWQKAIVGDIVMPGNPWTTLRDDIDRSMAGTTHSAKQIRQAYGDVVPLNDDKFHDSGSIIAAPHDPTKTSDIRGVVANAQTKFAAETEAGRAQRISAKFGAGPYLPGDPWDSSEKIDDGGNVKNKDDILTTGSVSTPVSDKELSDGLKKKRKEKLYERLKTSIKSTDDDRMRSAQSFRAVQGYLGGKVPTAAPTPPASPVLVAPKQNVHGGSTMEDRASHIYGSWAQRSSAAPNRSGNGKGQVCSSPDAAARIHGVYYSLQGDPILSRFFGFAFEIEFNRPDAVLSGASLWLAAADATEQIWTKASYHESGSSRYFWPASRFEENSQPGAALAVEQTNGVFNLGLKYDPAKPESGFRYDLTSLDVRGAVSGARDAQDLGQRHHTIGWTLLDRGRADQVARDLAISDSQNETRKAGGVLVLHAEELTIGRRLDVKAWRADGHAEWRSLMNRFVAFTNLTGEARSYLDRIVADRRREGKILDESSFQLMARSMPMLTADGAGDANTRPVEAVVEEAIQTWDGTPLAALARKSGGPPVCETSVLPVKRAYDLPREPHSHLRPPPLRYGVGYIFGIRSVFLGGGSPTIEDASHLHDAKQGAWTLPPSENNVTRPRHYLRHEGIDAPILMLPSSLVEKQNGKANIMGFEPPGQAIVRSRTPPDQLATPTCAAPKHPAGQSGADYVEAADRAEPNETLRVFVAPMVGFDFASRHRVFDDAKTADAVVRGGLLDVDFDEEKPRFPVAVVKRNPGFNGEKLVYRRERGWPSSVKDADSDGLGATVFKPRPPAKRKPAHGYLPDPAAQTMSLRLRVCGADNYLEGDVLVNLYDKGVAYPHALPLAVTINKRSARAVLATKITDVVSGDRTAIMRLGENGKIVSDSTGKGVRVRHLTISLAPAEQFDLEVTCLPTSKKLSEWFSLPETIGVQLLTAKDNAAIKKALMDCCGDLPLLADLIAANSGPASRAGLTGKPPPTSPGIGAISTGLLSCIQNRWPLTELASPTTLRVIHAVNAPKDAPSLQSLKILRPGSLENAKPAAPKPDGAKPPAGAVAACPASPNQICSDTDLVPGSATMLLSGEILVDLEQADMIDIVATVVNASGKPFDDANRGCGILAKRTGQWPRFTSDDGKERPPVPVRSVLGFDVEPDGKTKLLREVITLLRIQSLPDPRAACNSKVDGALQPFKPLRGRLTPLDLRALHLAAVSGGTITLPIALPKGAAEPQPKDGAPSHTRTLSVTRPHELSDTRARQLELRAVAFSRFAGTFETAPRFSEDGEEHVLHRRQPLQPQDQTHTGAKVTVWSPSTERPAACAAKTPTPFFSMNRCAKSHEKGVMQVLERDSGVRLRFDRGMFSSGEGERIAVVLWPPNIREQSLIGLDQNWVNVGDRWMQLSNFDDADLGDGGKFISRWGGDPIRSDPEPQKGFFMPWSAFDFFDKKDVVEQPHDPQYVASARMPVCAPPTDDSGAKSGAGNDKKTPSIEGFLDVALLTFEPYFDIDREEWFVDLPIRLARATDPFIRLGLVRYQSNSVCDDLKVSTPVRVWTQLPPRRHVSVTHKTVDKADISVRVLVRGQASDGVKPIPPSLQYLLKDPDDPKDAKAPKDPKKSAVPKPREVWERLQRPKMTLRLVHEGASTSFGRHQTNVFQDKLPSALPDPVNGEMVWTVDTVIPATRIGDLGPGRIFAIVEEVEERLAASYPNEPIEITQVLKAESIRESGPRFLARIPFLDV